MEAYRKIALHLHGLSETDSAWLLAQLPSEHVKPLEGLLAELNTLGIPREPSLFDELQAGTAVQPDASLKEDVPPVVQRLQSADISRLSSALTGESEQVIAVVIASFDWSWRDAVLASFPEPRRSAIIRLLSTKEKLPVKTCLALLQGLEKQLNQVAETRQGQVESLSIKENAPARHRRARRFAWQR